MPRYSDPVLNALSDLQDAGARTCPDPVDVATAALSGTAFLSDQDADHLLNHRCAECERWLEHAWSQTHAPPHVLERAERWPVGGALRTVVDRHVAACSEDACRAFAARVTPAPPKRRVTALARAREWLKPLGAIVLGDLVLQPSFATGQRNAGERDAQPGAVRPADDLGWFGAAVRLTPVDGDDTRLRLTVETDLLVGVRGRALIVVVFLLGQTDPLAIVPLDPPPGTRERDIDVPAQHLGSPKLRVVVGALDA